MNNLKKYRKKAGLTLAELGDRCGCGKSYLCTLEKAQKTNPSLQTAYKISAVFNCAVEDIWPNNVKTILIETKIITYKIIEEKEEEL